MTSPRRLATREKRGNKFATPVKRGYPSPSSPSATAVMRGNRSQDTVPEVRLRSALHRAGFRFRKNLPIVADGVRVRPDIVFTRKRVAVFVDGCFWHNCPLHGTAPGGPNAGYWRSKIERNAVRDLEQTDALRRGGWTVVRLWEHTDVSEAVQRIESALRDR